MDRCLAMPLVNRRRSTGLAATSYDLAICAISTSSYGALVRDQFTLSHSRTNSTQIARLSTGNCKISILEIRHFLISPALPITKQWLMKCRSFCLQNASFWTLLRLEEIWEVPEKSTISHLLSRFYFPVLLLRAWLTFRLFTSFKQIKLQAKSVCQIDLISTDYSRATDALL